jgi:hypothetical protein
MISHSKKFIFVHITKTGGTSIDIALRKYTKNTKTHQSILEMKEEAAKNFGLNNYFKFCFVRNPWDKMVSQYFYIKKKIFYDKSFEEFIIDFKSTPNDWGFKGKNFPVKYQPVQKKWICGDKGEVLMDFIGRFENLQEDFDTICDKIDLPKRELPHRNSTNHNDYSEYYNKETREIISQKFSEDIEYFGYKF